VLGASLFFYFIFPTFQYMKVYFYSFQLLLWILLMSLNQYKNHYLWGEPDFNPFQELPYPPINHIDIIKDNGQVSDIKVTYSNKAYSLIKTEEYSKKCIDNYFIPQSETCPITEIIIEYSNSDSDIYSDYEKLEISNGYIYYKTDSQQGKFYDSVRIDIATSNRYIMFGNKYKSIKFSHSFDYKDIRILKRLEENKILKPFKNFKNYKNTTDLVCFLITVFSCVYFFFGSTRNDKWNYFKIIDNVLQFILFILYLVRFILFGNVKNFFKDNKDLYNDKFLNFDRTKYFVNYFPKKMSINSFPLALSIVMIFFFLLSLFIKEKKCSAFDDEYKYDDYPFFNNEKNYRIIMISLPFLLVYLICFILDIINDEKIKKIYKNTIDNWDTSPITSIEANPNGNYELGHILLKKKEFYFYSWKYNNFTIKKNSDYNYMNMYSNDENNKKKCGTDNSGNSLYFPQDIECPINDIFIAKDDSTDYPEYTKLNLGLNNYLYYTNKEIDKNIIIDIKVGFPEVPLELSTKKTNELYSSIYDKGFYKEIDGKCKSYYKFNTIPFYNEIDHWDLYDFLENPFGLKNINYIGEISLYALTYQGFNLSSNGRNDHIIKYKKKMNTFITLTIVKSVFSSFHFIYYLIYFFVFMYDDISKTCQITSLIIITGMILFNFIIVIICLSYNVIYVQNIMNKINNDFERKRISYSWILSIFFLDASFLFYYISIIFYLSDINFKECCRRFCKINLKDCCCSCCEINLKDCCRRCCERKNKTNISEKNKTIKNDEKVFNKNKNKEFDQNTNNSGKRSEINNNNNNNNNNINNPITLNDNRNNNIKEDGICIDCHKAKATVSFGCGHMCYCYSCFDKKDNKNLKNCPICERPIISSIRVSVIRNNFVSNI